MANNNINKQITGDAYSQRQQSRDLLEELTVEQALHKLQVDNANKNAQLQNRLAEEVAKAKFKLEKENVLKINELDKQEALKVQDYLDKNKQTLDEKTRKKITASEVADKRKEALRRFKEEKERNLELASVYSKAYTRELKKANKEVQRSQEKLEYAQLMADKDVSAGDKIKASFKEGVKSLGDKLRDEETWEKFNKAIENLGNEINSIISTYSKYQSSINTRLVGTSQTFQTLTKTLTKNIGTSPYFTTQELYDNLSSLVNAGTSFNLEQRAFLMSISDKVATTFDALDTTLLRLTRLQQADTTAARLGMEEALTRALNNTFQDTSYLSDVYNTVESALVDAISLAGATTGIDVEYAIQKWLGSLYSIGVSSGTITSLATAMNSLLTGDYASLEGSGVGTLVLRGAEASGTNLSEALANGLDASEISELLKGILTQLQVASKESSNVIKSSLASLYGVSIADLTAVSSLSKEDVDAINNSMLSYSGALSSLSNSLASIDERVSFAEKTQNLLENFKFSLGANIAQNPTLAATWGITDLIQNVTGGINIPSFTTFGTGFNLNTTVENLMKLSMIGVSTLSGISQIVMGLGSISDYSKIAKNLGILSSIQTTTRGEGLLTTQRGQQKSLSTQISTSGEDIGEFYTQKATEDIQTKYGTQEEQKTTNDIYNLLTNTSMTSYMSIYSSKFDTIISLLQNYNSGMFGVNPSTNNKTQGVSGVIASNETTSYQDKIDSIASNVGSIYAMFREIIGPDGLKVVNQSSTISGF